MPPMRKPGGGACLLEPGPSTHRGPGTSESTWLLDPRWDHVPRLAIDLVMNRCQRVVVIGMHRDDATLSLGATIADLADKGLGITVVSATHGGLHLSEDELRERLAGLVDARTLLLAPVEGDGHANHAVVARVTESAARETGALLLNYPLRLWDWASPSDLDWQRLRMFTPSLGGLRAKADAIDCFTGQLGQAAFDRACRVVETVLVPQTQDLVERVEVAVVAPRSHAEIAGGFDMMYESGDTDPWHLDDSVYERRRLALVLACLGRTRYNRVLEIGCATGQLCALLNDRADEVVGLDASERALDVARGRTDAVRWVIGAAPRDIPDADFDLIVLSEIAYFLDGADLLATLRAARRRLRPHGEIVMANWLRPTVNIPLDGPTVHRQASAMLDLSLRARYEDADLAVQVWGEPESVYDAYEGVS